MEFLLHTQPSLHSAREGILQIAGGAFGMMSELVLLSGSSYPSKISPITYQAVTFFVFLAPVEDVPLSTKFS